MFALKRWKQGFVLLLVCVAYGLVSLYGAYLALSRNLTGRDLERQKSGEFLRVRKPIPILEDSTVKSPSKEVHIWDTCGLGIFLWRNILGGEISRYNLKNGWVQSGLEFEDFKFKYYLGYGLDPDRALQPHPYIVLIINARDKQLFPKAKSWLDHVLKSAYIDFIGVMLLGSESCDNDWIQPYLQQKRIKYLFIVYDSPLVDDEFVFQWPLGVASYRNFQNFDQELLDLTASRKYVFNFVGTVYEDSTRVDMLNTVNLLGDHTNKYIKTRSRWVPEEDQESMTEYQHVLLQSDLTLSPAGRNAECYRTYEAIELGSIPVIEDIVTEGTCDYITEDDTRNVTSPYRLLKTHNAPVIFVKDWDDELPRIVREFTSMSHAAKVRSRINLLRWYADFKSIMREKFIRVVNEKFFGA